MKQAPQMYFAAYTDVLRSSILTAKSLMLRNTQMIDNLKKATAILDAISAVPEALFQWEDSHEVSLRKRLEYFDSIWAREDGDFSLMKIYRKHIEV
jgi:hypothetical protein